MSFLKIKLWLSKNFIFRKYIIIITSYLINYYYYLYYFYLFVWTNHYFRFFQMACTGLVDPGPVASAMTNPTHQHPLQDYSYAYFEPGPSRLHGTYPAEVGLNRVQQQQQQQVRPDSFKRHTYMTRYGTEENIYEEISEIKWEIYHKKIIIRKWYLSNQNLP